MESIENIKKKIENSLKNSRNLNFLLGSGCSLGKQGMPSMSELMQNLLSDLCIKQYIDKKLVDEYEVFKSSEIEDLKLEEYLNKIIQEILLNKKSYFIYEENKKPIIEILTKSKEILRNSLHEKNNQIISNKNESDVIRNYINFYKKILTKRNDDSINEIKNPINIFTTNYDLLNEIGMEENGIIYNSGFSGEVNRVFDVKNFKFRIVDSENRYSEKWDPLNKYINLYKIHGSLNWATGEKSDEIIQYYSKGEMENTELIIYPTVNKTFQTMEHPFNSLFRELSIQMQKDNSTLFVIGYGFGDEHINKIIAQSLVNESFNLIIFATNDLIKSENFKKFKSEIRDSAQVFTISGVNKNNGDISFFNNIVNFLL